jgi:hypothetical protein
MEHIKFSLMLLLIALTRQNLILIVSILQQFQLIEKLFYIKLFQRSFSV